LVIASAREKIASLGFMIAAEVKYSPQGLGIDSAMTRLLPVGNRTNFDALLIPEGGSVLATILRALRARGVSPVTVQFLGTGVWDDSTLVRRVPLDGAWVASASPKETMAFEKRFRATYQYIPPRITSLAYDAVAFAVTLASSGRPFDNKTITHNAGFIGPVNGPFRLHGDGHVDRGLAIMSVEGGIFTPIDAAPAGFKK
jgi:branched-chain amino acid transport system substrate-binding protein